VPGRFGYPCPDCRSRNNLHEPDCQFSETEWAEVERAYVEILAVLSTEPTPETALRNAVGRWSALHQRALARLQEDHRVEDTESGNLAVVPPEERRERLREPTYDPVRTVYEKGSVPGAHDNAVFAMIAFYEMVGFAWPETKQLVVDWLRESGTWARGGFEEDSPEALVESKRHVYEEGYGWKEKASAAKAVIDRNL
jgi:hypothetical protein